jgi:hypothetical protein
MKCPCRKFLALTEYFPLRFITHFIAIGWFSLGDLGVTMDAQGINPFIGSLISELAATN